MVRRTILIICCMIVAALACDIFGVPVGKDDSSSQGSGVTITEPDPYVESVSVKPTSTRTFIGTVVYLTGQKPGKITCVAKHSNGLDQLETHVIDVPGESTSRQLSASFNYSVPTSGRYNFVCTQAAGEGASAPFDAEEEQESPPDNPEAAKPVQFTDAKITFDLAKIVFQSTPPGGMTSSWLQAYCWPPADLQNNGKSYFTVGEDGTLKGLCSIETRTDQILGEINGKYDAASSNVSFTLTTSHKWTANDGVSYNIGTVVFKGEGKVVDKITSDIANFHYTCEAHGEAHCVEEFQDIVFDGQVPFTLTLMP